MLWVVAILTMAVGAVLAIAQSDIKRMLAYSSVAHTGFLLTGLVGLQSTSALTEGELTSLQAVLFYLVTYGFTTLGAFAVVKRHYAVVMRLGGGLLVVVGLLLVSGLWGSFIADLRGWVSGFETAV